jgi:3-oxoacyl-[acyl-carrier-protein] synthase-3
MNSAKPSAGIAGAACAIPVNRESVQDVAQQEHASPDTVSKLGIEQVPACNGETGSSLALAAAREALQRAGVEAAQLDVIIDYSILPQEFLVPAWNMSNKVQHELGATKAFTVGFSGGASANFLVALSSAAAMLQTDGKVKAVLLVAGDVAIRGNRIPSGSEPVTVLGDSASAVVLKRDAERAIVVDVEIETRGENHDLYYIPGGALAHDEPDRYRVMIDGARYEAALNSDHLKDVVDRLLQRNGLRISEVSCVVMPNVSQKHHEHIEEMLGLDTGQVCVCKLRDHGHLQGTDLVLNYQSLIERNSLEPGKHVLIVSDGMGSMSAAALLRY